MEDNFYRLLCAQLSSQNRNSLFPGLLLNCPSQRKRERPPSRPELELELAKWYASFTTPPKGQEVKEKAIDLWRDFAPKHYMGQKQPGFGNSWRGKVKTRHGFKPENVS